MTSLVVYNCINSLQNSHKPIIIFATPDEAEAVLNACKENKIKVLKINTPPIPTLSCLLL